MVLQATAPWRHPTTTSERHVSGFRLELRRERKDVVGGFACRRRRTEDETAVPVQGFEPVGNVALVIRQVRLRHAKRGEGEASPHFSDKFLLGIRLIPEAGMLHPVSRLSWPVQWASSWKSVP